MENDAYAHHAYVYSVGIGSKSEQSICRCWICVGWKSDWIHLLKLFESWTLSRRIHCYVPKTGFTAYMKIKLGSFLASTSLFMCFHCLHACTINYNLDRTWRLWSWGMHVPHGPCIWHWHRPVHRRHHTLLTAPGTNKAMLNMEKKRNLKFYVQIKISSDVKCQKLEYKYTLVQACQVT